MDKEIQKEEKEIEEVEVGDNKGMTKEQREIMLISISHSVEEN